MSKYIFPFIFLIGSACTINSVTPSNGLEIDMSFDLSASDMRHGWAYVNAKLKGLPPEGNPESIARGQQLFLQHCQKCHGVAGKGDGPLAKTLSTKPANLQKIGLQKSGRSLVVQIKDGKGTMPQWRDVLTEKQTWDLSNYIKSIAKK